MSRFPKVPLGECLAHRAEFITIEDDREYKRARVQLHGRGIVLRDQVSGAEIRTKKQQVAREGELLVAEIDAKVGGFGVVPPELDGAVVSSHYFLYTIDERKCLKGWLDAYVKSGGLEEQVSSRGSTNYAAIRPAHVLQFQIPLPPLDEQRRIVDKVQKLLNRVQEIAETRAQALESVESAWRSVAEKTIARYQSERDQPLGELVSVRGGGTPSKGNPYFWQGTIPWVSPKDMKMRVIRDAQDHISEEAVADSPAKLLEPGCVLVVTRGMIMAHTVPSAVLAVPAAINQDMKALVPRSGIRADFLCTILWGLNAQILELVERSTHDTRKLETNKLLGFKIPVPSLTEQEHVVARLAAMEAKLSELEQLQRESALRIDALAPSILDKAFKGEL